MATTRAGTDMDRMRPTTEQVCIALAMLSQAPRRVSHVVVPIAFPGKTHGIWFDGQPVEHPGGYWLADRTTRSGTYSASHARDAAEAAALAHLSQAGRTGTPGYVSIRRDATWAVFEGYAAEELDTASSASRQHFIDAGHHLRTDGSCTCDDDPA